MTYPTAAAVVAAYEITDGHSYSQLAAELNRQRISPPPRSRQWTKWSARWLCRSIGKPSRRGPKMDTARQQVNKSLGKLMPALPSLGGEFTPADLAATSGAGLTSCRKYHPLIQAIHAGDIDPAAFDDCYHLWSYWKALGTLDEEAAPQ